MRIIEQFGGLDRGLDRVCRDYARWLGWSGGVGDQGLTAAGELMAGGLASGCQRAGGGVASARTGRAINPFGSGPRRLKVMFHPGHREVLKIRPLKNARGQKACA